MQSEFSNAKITLRECLNSLRAELDRCLAGHCGIASDEKARYEKWRENHRPFHWFVEFYGIIRDGGFDVVIGNPPYVGIPKYINRGLLQDIFSTVLTTWSRDENLYTIMMERSAAILKPDGKLGMILPLSVASSTKRPFFLLRRRLSAEVGSWWWSHFDRIPSALFGNEVRTRCTIAILSRDQKQGSCHGHTTALQRWEAEHRSNLFPSISYAEFLGNIDAGIPKVGTNIQAKTLMRLLRSGKTLASDLTAPISYAQLATSAPDFPNHSVFVGGTAYNWFPAWREIPETVTAFGEPSVPARTIGFRFADEATANIIFAILCSSLGYWWWAVASDGFNLKKWLLLRFPLSLSMVPSAAKRELAILGESLRIELRKHYVFKDNKGRIGNFLLRHVSRR